jgi:catechol 2,3-dioxygenase-like lactoylglutathione lyase family enzyme
MSSIDHVTIRVADLASGRRFYDRVFELVGWQGGRLDALGGHEWNDFSMVSADAEHPATSGLHVAFATDSEERVDRWWRALTEAGYRDDGAPGPRPQYGSDYYGGFVLDDAGNSVEAVTHERARAAENGAIDHLWIRVDELEPVARFYAEIAPALGLRAQDRGERFFLAADRGSFTFLEGEATRSLHLAIGVGGRGAVEEFHAAALAAGARDNGPPGERPQYHPGYFGAFVLDPAGTNLEAVFHDR